ncbi:hypothetical protein M758_UG274100 [Ceratodon purpureus]|nr:hypothetical protein M758_UG274100 [Ceratodon purpureus]
MWPGTLSITAKTKKLDVDSCLSLKYYYRTADNLLKQARIYRDEGNVIDYYILLLRFSSLVSETIPEHREYRLYAGENKDYRSRMLDVITELEKLKPEVQKQVDLYNRAFLKVTALSYSVPPSYSLPCTPSSYNLPSYNCASQPDTGVAWPSYDRSQSFSGGVKQNKFGRYGKRAPVSGYGDSGSGYNLPSSSQISIFLEDQLKTLSLNIPRPTEDTLSRHSILGPNTQRPRREPAPLRVQYPSDVDTTPIELPRFVTYCYMYAES